MRYLVMKKEMQKERQGIIQLHGIPGKQWFLCDIPGVARIVGMLNVPPEGNQFYFLFCVQELTF